MRPIRRMMLLLCAAMLACVAPATLADAAPTTRPASTRPVAVKASPETIADLRALQSRVKSVLEQVQPSVVGLRVGGGQGSGVIISDDGYVLTAGHVSGEPGRDVTVVLTDGKTVKAKSLGFHYMADTGLVKINEPPPGGGKWPFVQMGRSAPLSKGQWCVTLGHPGGFKTGRTPPLRLGRILDARSLFIRTDCTLVGGDSGGPLFDLDGKVIGIHSRIGTSLSENMHVPVDTFRNSWERLVAGDVMGVKEWLGRPGGPVLGLDAGADCTVNSVNPKSPAEAGGIEAGDVITSFDGTRVTTFEQLQRQLARSKAGSDVSIEVRRDGKPLKLTVKLGKRLGM